MCRFFLPPFLGGNLFCVLSGGVAALRSAQPPANVWHGFTVQLQDLSPWLWGRNSVVGFKPVRRGDIRAVRQPRPTVVFYLIGDGARGATRPTMAANKAARWHRLTIASQLGSRHRLVAQEIGVFLM